MHSSFLGVRTYLIMSPQAWVKVVNAFKTLFISFYNIAKVQAQNVTDLRAGKWKGFTLFAFEKELKYNMIAV